MCVIGWQQKEDSLNKLRTAWVQAMPGPVPPDPLIKELENDPVVAEFHPDAFYSCETCCLAVVYSVNYPLNGLSFLCACGRMACAPAGFRQYSKGRRLILREHSLLYELDKDAPSHPMGLCCCAEDSVVREPVQMLFLLKDDFTIEGMNASDMSTIALKIKGNVVAYITLSSVVPDPSGTSFGSFRDKFNAQKQSQEFLPPPAVSSVGKAQHEAMLSYHQFVTSVPQNSELTSEDLVRQSKAFYDHLVAKLKAIESGAPIPVDEMDRNIPATNQTILVAQPFPTEAEMVRDVQTPLINMTTSDVLNMLKNDLQLEQYVTAFEKAGVNGAMLSILDDATLSEIGVSSNLDRKRILAWILQNK